MPRSLSTAIFALALPLGLGAQGATFGIFEHGCRGTGGAARVVLPIRAHHQVGAANNTAGVTMANVHYQQIFHGDEVGASRVFTGHSFRMDELGFPGGSQVLEWKLSETTVAPSAMSRTLSSNVTGAQTTVFTKRGYNFPNATTNLNPRLWNIVIKYDKPFVWTATPGRHLLVESWNTSGTNLLYVVDAMQNPQHRVSRVLASPTTSLTGWIDYNFGLAMAFQHNGGGSEIPHQSSGARPILGTNFKLDLIDAKAGTPGALIFGFSRRNWGSIPLPLDLAPLGAPGCPLWVSADMLFPVATDSTGKISVSLPIPNQNGYLGISFFTQFLIVDPGANAFGFALSNAGAGRIGAF